MRLSRRTAIKGGFASASLVAASIPSRRGDAQPATSRLLRFVPEFDLRILDPIVNTGLVTLQHGYMIYDTLFAMDSTFTPRPQMVGQYAASADGMTHDFTLRDGLKFHDGTPVRAQDCVASIRRWGARDVMGRSMLARTASLVAADERSFRLVLREPYPIVLDALAKISGSPCFIMREREAQTDPNTAVTETIGSGPFRFVREEYRPGDRVVYVRNADYVPRSEPTDGYAGAKIARVERVQWHIIADATTQVNALVAGEVEIVNTPPLDVLATLRRDPSVKVANIDPQGWMAYIRPNFLYPPFNDVRARQALAYVVNQADYLRVAAGDPANWRECRAFMVCGSPMGSEAGMDAHRGANLERARQLMREAGYNGEPIVVLLPTDNPILTSITEVTINNLRQIGVNVQPAAADLATAFARRARREPPAQGGWHIFHTRSLGVELNNPLTSFPLASPCTRDAQGNLTGWFGWSCDERIEDLRTQWTVAPNAQERRRVAELLQQRAAEFLPFIPLGQMYTPIAHRANVRGLIEMPIPVMWNLSIG